MLASKYGVAYNNKNMNDLRNEGFVRRNAIWLVVIAALVAFGLLLFKGWDKVVNNGIDSMITITGNFACLPVKDTAQVVPEEDCTLGVKSRDGSYYALDISRIQDANTDLKANDTIAVTGTLKPDSEAKNSNWVMYDIDGVVQVNTLLRTR